MAKMTSNSNENKPDLEVLLKQYEQSWQVIRHLDSSYIQMSLLYIALMGAYIGAFDKIGGDHVLISISLLLITLFIIGAIYRLRKLVDQQFSIIFEIEKITAMKKGQEIKGVGKVKTSTWLIITILIMTTLAIILTVTK